MDNYELICVIVDFGKGSKVVKYAKQNGISGATIFLGKGTVNNHILKLLDLTDVRKEIVLMIAKENIVQKAIDAIHKKFQLDKPNHGIAFTISVRNIIGVRNCDVEIKTIEKRGLENKMYQAIFVVVDRGRAESVLDSALAAGAKGATIINGRGSGIHETKMLFSFPIEPEKDIVMILTEENVTDSITEAVRIDLKIDEPGMGIMFILDVNKAYGLY